MNRVVLLLGSNLGDKRDFLARATRALSAPSIDGGVGSIVRSSKVYQSEPHGFTSDNQFVNQVLEIDTVLEPLQLLDAIQVIELKLGRDRSYSDLYATHDDTAGAVQERVYRDRVIDIDILYYNDLIFRNERLIIPHPEILNREFVMIPLRELGLL